MKHPDTGRHVVVGNAIDPNNPPVCCGRPMVSESDRDAPARWWKCQSRAGGGTFKATNNKVVATRPCTPGSRRTRRA